MDWSRAESNPPPEYQSRRHHPGTSGVTSVHYHHSPTPSHTLFLQTQTQTSTLLPNIQAPTSTLVSQLQPQPQQPAPGPSGAEVVMAAKVQQMVQLLCEENQTLKQELLTHREKASKLHWLEEELQRISEEYDWLMKSSSKREGLDRTMRCKLEGEIRRLTVFNRDLRDRLVTANQHLACREEDGHAAELSKCVWGCRGGQCPCSEGAGSRGWEQKYLQENAMRHFNMETAATANPHRDTLVVHSHSGSYSEMMGCTLWQGGTVYSRLPDAAITWSTAEPGWDWPGPRGQIRLEPSSY
ncbi:hypothetical protein J4Q44_G00339260 [Coregonus suidteri]|uniref:Angiomotin C-terminal domain-containing protein n=1 Tax=Coregonus suidteri TaxID=861788 RepID=A0AAN8KQP4_9TELE